MIWNLWRTVNSAREKNLRLSNERRYLLAPLPLDALANTFGGADFSRANLSRATLKRADLGLADLRAVNLKGADLSYAELQYANLQEANLEGANLTGVRADSAYLRGANLRGARLNFGQFANAVLDGANLEGAEFLETRISNVDLTLAERLGSCVHYGPSSVDHRTLAMSKNVPTEFWRGCGLPDALIDYMPSLTGDAIEFYSCFISHSSKDQDFAKRLHADLQDNGVRCWFAPHDLEIGAVIEDEIDAQIRVRDKVILILSEASVASAWVTREVRTALDEEQQSKRRVLFPLCLDGAVMDTTEQWVYDLQRRRNIGDFTQWKNHDAYQATFKRVLRDLRAES